MGATGEQARFLIVIELVSLCVFSVCVFVCASVCVFLCVCVYLRDMEMMRSQNSCGCNVFLSFLVLKPLHEIQLCTIPAHSHAEVD